jgi:hypothetical protein
MVICQLEINLAFFENGQSESRQGIIRKKKKEKKNHCLNFENFDRNGFR